MSVRVTQGVDAWLRFRLTKDGVGVTGVTHTTSTCKVLRATDVAFAAKTLNAGNFDELSDGFYQIQFTGASDLSVLLAFIALVQGAAFDDCEVTAEVVAAADAVDAYEVPVCTISGRLVGDDGKPLAGVTIWWRIMTSSLVLGALVDKVSRSTTSRADGTFSFDVPRTVVVAVDCPRVDYSRTLTVPNQASASLFEIP